MSMKKRNLDLFLGEVFKQSIAIKDEDYKKAQEVFNGVFYQVKQKMGEKCNYFGKYASQDMFAGSVYDGLKVSKLDEFDMDIVIRLPVNYNEITIEPDHPGFVKLKIDAFDNLDKQQDWEKCHKVTRDWRDPEKYFRQDRFRHWLSSLVQKALNDLDGRVTVNGTTYVVKYKESGPAYTLNVHNDTGGEEFKLDVDLVPVIRFQHPRWPEGYRTVEETNVKDWLVVPKPNKAVTDNTLKKRCWRLSFQEFERDMMKGCQQLKTTIRLLKKLRDSLNMKDIASYYIKTLFLWKIHEQQDKKYWQNKLSVIFRIMVEELYNAIKNKNIPYFWHEHNNLIAGLKPTIQLLYTEKLKAVLDSIDSNDVDKVVFYLLTTDELQAFKRSEFYEKQPQISSASMSASVSRQESISSLSSVSSIPDVKIQVQKDRTFELVKAMSDKINALSENGPMMKIMKSLNDKIDVLNEKIDRQNEKLEKLETEMRDKIETLTDKIENQNEKLKKFEIYDRNHKGSNDIRELAGLTHDLLINHNEIRLMEGN